MKYETPEVTELTPAMNAIQTISGKLSPPHADSEFPEAVNAYQDNEE